MPLYEFTCSKCGHQFEELLTLSELNKGNTKCPACKSKRIQRGLSAFATSGPVGGFPSGGGCGSGGFT